VEFRKYMFGIFVTVHTVILDKSQIKVSVKIFATLDCFSELVALKVPSGQIGSAGEWYHWIGLEKDINRYMFFIF
jgi:hypothetical protein